MRVICTFMVVSESIQTTFVSRSLLKNYSDTVNSSVECDQPYDLNI